jgi:hypothetical protein
MIGAYGAWASELAGDGQAKMSFPNTEFPGDLDYCEILGLRAPIPTMVLNDREDQPVERRGQTSSPEMNKQTEFPLKFISSEVRGAGMTHR